MDKLKSLKVYCKKFTSSKIVGYPKITDYKVQCLKLEENELSNLKPLMKVESLKPLFSSENKEKNNTVGYSGGGIFVYTPNKLYLVGITTHVETTAFQGFKYSPLDDINSFLGEYPKIQIYNDILDNASINKIRSISVHNYQSANIYIDSDFENITLGNLYIKRDIEDEIFDFLNSEDRYNGIVIKGEAGNGKTSLLWKIAKDLKEYHQECWFLKSSNFLNISNLFEDIKNNATLFQKELNKDLFILIDTIDLISSQEGIIIELISMISTIKMLSINVIFILTSRQREASILNTLKLKNFNLKDYDENSNELNSAIESYVECFYNKKQTMDKEESLNKILNGVSEGRSLKEVCKHPLTLRMLFTIYFPNTIPEEINVFKLYKDFWEKRIVKDIRAGENSDKDFEDLSFIAGAVAFVMLAEGMIELEEDILVECLKSFSIKQKDIEILIKRNILLRSNNIISFFHQTFFEHVCARGFLNIFKRNALDIFENKVKEDDFENLFLMPIYEQMILLANLKGASYKNIIKSKFEILCITNHSSKYSAIYIFSHLNSFIELKDSFKNFLIENLEDEALIKWFLSVIYNIDNSNITFIIDIVQIIWRTKNSNYRFNILSLLEEISYQNKEIAYHFIVENDIDKYIQDSYLESSSTGPVLDRALILIKTYLHIISIDEEVILNKILNFISFFDQEKRGSSFELKTIQYLSKKEKINEKDKYLQNVLTRYNQKIRNRDIILAYGIYLSKNFISKKISIENVLEYVGQEKKKKQISYSILVGSISEYLRYMKDEYSLNITIEYFQNIQDTLTPSEIIDWAEFFFLHLLGVVQNEKEAYPYKNSILEYIKILLIKICNGENKYFSLVKKLLYENENLKKEDYSLLNDSNFTSRDLWIDGNKLSKFLIQGYLADNEIAKEIVVDIICKKHEGTLTNTSFNFLLKKMIKYDLINEKNIMCIVEYILHNNNFVILKEIYVYNNQNIIKLLRMDNILEAIKKYLYKSIEELGTRSSPSKDIKSNVETLNYFLEKEFIKKIEYGTLIKYLRYNNCLNSVGKVIDSYFIKNLAYLELDEKIKYLDEIFILVEDRIVKSKYFNASIISTFDILKNCIVSTNSASKYIKKYYELLISIVFYDNNTLKNITEYTKNIFHLLTSLMPTNVEQFISIFTELIGIFNKKLKQLPSNSIRYFSARIEIPLTSFFKSKYVNEKNMLDIFIQLEKSDSQLSRGIITAVFNNSQNRILMDVFDKYIQEKSIDSILLQKINNHKKHHKEQVLDSDWAELYDLLEDRK